MQVAGIEYGQNEHEFLLYSIALDSVFQFPMLLPINFQFYMRKAYFEACTDGYSFEEFFNSSNAKFGLVYRTK